MVGARSGGCEWERERDRELERDREKDAEREKGKERGKEKGKEKAKEYHESVGATSQTQPSLSPGAVMKHALRGRWRLSPPTELLPPTSSPSTSTASASTSTSAFPPEPEGNLLVETRGPTDAYTYRLQLTLRSGTAMMVGGGATATRNTKLVWRGFWSYNRLTDDWAEFGLRNDRAFVWSRVRSWGDA